MSKKPYEISAKALEFYNKKYKAKNWKDWWKEKEFYKDKDYLQQEYLEKDKNVREISKKHDVSPSTIYYWMKKLDVAKK